MAKKKKTLEELIEEAIVPEDEQPYEVPDNWVWLKFGIIIELISGRDLKLTDCNDEEEGIPYILGASNIENNIFTITRWTKTPTVIGKENDILLSVKGTIGKLLILKEKEIHLSRQIMAIRVLDSSNRLYIYYFLKNYIDELIQKSRGVIPGISREDILSIQIPLPNIKEQQRIVNKIESLFSKIDKAKMLIEEARKEFKNRKAAILAKAFRGELTKIWRKEHSDVESAEVILRNIELMREKLKSAEKNKVSMDILKEPFILPTTWRWTKLGDICYKFKYGTSKKSSKEGTVPVLRMGNLQGGKIDWRDLVYTSDEDEIKKYELVYNDILFNRTNSPELVGKTSIYKGEMQAIFAGYLIRVRPFELINNNYINYFLNSTYAKYKCYEVKTDGVSQSNINSQKLGEFEIPLPPLEEQKEIVLILNKLLEQGSKIEELTDLEDQIELIKKSILSKAFRGQLGTNDPTEEIALELLKEVLKKKTK